MGSRPIDPQTDLSNGLAVENAAMAFEFVDDWNLNLTATRFELQDLKRTSIACAVVRAVALCKPSFQCSASTRLRSVGQCISIKMPAGFDATTSLRSQPISVNGRRVTPERGGPDQIDGAADRPKIGRCRPRTPLHDSGVEQVDLPEFLDEPAVDKVDPSCLPAV